MKVNVKAKSAYGVLPVEEGAKWVNVDKGSKAALDAIVPGNTYELDKENFFTSATLVGELKKKANGGNGTKGNWKKKGADDGMSKGEWAAKDAKANRQWHIKSAVETYGAQGVDPLEVFESKAAPLAEKMIAFTNKGE